MNNKFVIKVEAPLVRPGLTITTEVSERYAVRAALKLIEIVRELNKAKP